MTKEIVTVGIVTVAIVTVAIVTVVIAIVVIVTIVIVTVVIVTVVIVNIFSKNNFNILTTEENFEGQRFAILAMFYVAAAESRPFPIFSQTSYCTVVFHTATAETNQTILSSRYFPRSWTLITMFVLH